MRCEIFGHHLHQVDSGSLCRVNCEAWHHILDKSAHTADEQQLALRTTDSILVLVDLIKQIHERNRHEENRTTVCGVGLIVAIDTPLAPDRALQVLDTVMGIFWKAEDRWSSDTSIADDLRENRYQ